MPLTTAPAPAAGPTLFAIQYGAADYWMNAGGNLGSATLCALFASADEASAFLASRKLRAGFREHMTVQPVDADALRYIEASAAECLAACLRRNDATHPDVQDWRDRVLEVATLAKGLRAGVIEGQYRVLEAVA